jgi:hypothetical protein
MMDAARTSETSVDNYFIRQYIPEDKSELNQSCCTEAFLIKSCPAVVQALHLLTLKLCMSDRDE